MLSQQALQEFKQIWREEYQEEISDEFAMEQGINILTLFNNIYRPVKKDWLKESTIQVTNLAKGTQVKSSYKSARP